MLPEETPRPDGIMSFPVTVTYQNFGTNEILKSKNDIFLIPEAGRRAAKRSRPMGNRAVQHRPDRSHKESYMRNNTTPAKVCHYPHPRPPMVRAQYLLSQSPGMSDLSYLSPSTSSLQSTERIGQGAICGESQRQTHRYASFSFGAYQLVSKHGPRATVHRLIRSTSSTTIRFLTSFISIDRPSLTETRVISSLLMVGRHGTVKDGGTNSHKFVKDGEMSYSGQHPIWIFASSVHMAHQLQICWDIHLPSHSSWNIFA